MSDVTPGPEDANGAAPLAAMSASADLTMTSQGALASARSAEDQLVGSLRTSYLKAVLGSFRLKEAQRRAAVCAWYDATALSAPPTTSAETEAAGATATSQASGEAIPYPGPDPNPDATHAAAADRGGVLAKRVTAELAATLRYPLKLSRWRMVGRVMGILIISYADIVTDVLMLLQYSRSNMGAFVASATFLGLGLLLHAFRAYLMNAGRGARAIAWEILLAATFMAPAVATYRFVVGEEPDKNRTTVLEPVFMYALVKMVELLGESIPECVLQASVLLSSDLADVTYLSVISFAGSLLAAGMLIADLNLTTESARMKEQQTPGMHPLYGEFCHRWYMHPAAAAAGSVSPPRRHHPPSRSTDQVSFGTRRSATPRSSCPRGVSTPGIWRAPCSP